MFNSIVAFALLILVGASSLVTVADAGLADFDVGSEMEEFIPNDVKNFYGNLNTEDRAVLKRVLSQASSYANVSAASADGDRRRNFQLSSVLTDLKNGSSALYDKAVSIVTDVRGTVAALSPPARNFLDETVAQVQRALSESLSFTKLKDEAKLAVQRYQALDRPTKDELKGSFPIVMSVIDNGVFQTLASGIFGIGEVASAAIADRSDVSSTASPTATSTTSAP